VHAAALQAADGRLLFTVVPPSHELCWKLDVEHDGLASQHSELVQLLTAQLVVGSDAFTVVPAAHELC